jgi:hypothetical protein
LGGGQSCCTSPFQFSGFSWPIAFLVSLPSPYRVIILAMDCVRVDVRAVTRTEECPSRCQTTGGGTPPSSISEAIVFRSKCSDDSFGLGFSAA